MANLTDAASDTALKRGQLARAEEPRAATARYDRQVRRVIVDLTNGCTFAFPLGLAQGLDSATEISLQGSKSWVPVTGCTGRRWMWTCRSPVL